MNVQRPGEVVESAIYSIWICNGHLTFDGNLRTPNEMCYFCFKKLILSVHPSEVLLLSQGTYAKELSQVH